MFDDGERFLRRANLFKLELQKGKYPNAAKLAKLARCSPNTAQRTINRLREAYGLPISYDQSRKGYVLTGPESDSPKLPPNKIELITLLLAKDLTRIIDSEDLRDRLDDLWLKYASSGSVSTTELEEAAACFSSSSTAIAQLMESSLLELVTAAARSSLVEIRYRSPWRHNAAKIYAGQILRVEFSDGAVYLRFKESGGREILLHASFILSFTIKGKAPKARSAGRKRGFGIWSGADLTDVEIEIQAPGSSYYAKQIWHDRQEDSWSGRTLIRRFPSAISPELVRRILSLGSFVSAVRPEGLRRAVANELRAMSENLT